MLLLTATSPISMLRLMFSVLIVALFAGCSANYPPICASPADVLSYGHAVLAANVLYSGGEFGYLYAQQVTDGKLLWSHDISSDPIAAPVIANGVIYARTSTAILALHANDGTVIWQAPFSGMNFLNGEDTLAADASDVFVVTANYQAPGMLVALGTTDGTQRWSVSVPDLQNTRPVVDKGIVYVTGDGLSAFNAGTGAQLWHTPAPIDHEQYTDPALVNGVLYVTTMESDLTAPASTPIGKQSAVDAIDAQTGTLRWHSIMNGWPAAPVAVAQDTIFSAFAHSSENTPTTATIVALDSRTGVARWSVQPPASMTFFQQPMPSLLVTGDSLYLPGFGVTAVQLSTHTLRWQQRINPRPTAPVVANATVLYTDSGGSLNFVCGAGPHQPTPTDGATAAVQSGSGHIIWQQTLKGGHATP